jgi:hypothetical protein
LPDYRGQFLRGFDNTAATDPDAASRTNRGDGTTGDAVGTKQADAFQGHYHDVFDNVGGSGNYIVRFNVAAGGSNSWAQTVSAASTRVKAFTPLADGTNGTPRITSETRPTNINVMYCIKL